MALPFNYIDALYRKDNNGKISVWFAETFDVVTIKVYYGKLNGTILEEYIKTNRKTYDEIDSRRKSKRKAGYKYLNEIRDDVNPPVEGELLSWLETYLPEDRTDADNENLVMLAKSFDKANNIFKNISHYFGQWKINGLRCSITAEESVGLFTSYKLIFHPREGGTWKSLDILEEYLLAVIPEELLEAMCYDGWALDGEVYIPGYTVNDINSAVKNVKNPLNSLVQYWCYDLIIPESSQETRFNTLDKYFSTFTYAFGNKNSHLNNENKLVYLPKYIIQNERDATMYRDKFIEFGFEGLIMRNPYKEYQFGKRNMAMLKYKCSTDGKFLILDIYPEGIKRNDIPLFKLKNDINDSTFEVHISGTFEEQKKYLYELKEQTIGKYMFVEFGERSGINQVPFHVKKVTLLNNV